MWNPNRNLKLLEEGKPRSDRIKLLSKLYKSNGTRNIILLSLQAHKEWKVSPTIKCLHTTQNTESQLPRVTILPNPRSFPGEGKYQKAIKGLLSARGRKSQTQ
ncbi:hypothetical protein O181_130253 [Austropuccinia psidii MF-1]|uniref:Uncharacterized protein n=1 Tax=Austropuccinia psidii MF-1 TaxID=1389203 RepID=A0A9Q3Q9L8_9BASI|nr:hypothetical protein [Austropuccinia psidii MF-1]